MDTVHDKIRREISENKVVLFMKGNSERPYCGFSATVVSILQKIGVDFKHIDVLQSNDLRQGIKEYSNWPTIPQLYIGGEFIGGADIVQDLYMNGELKKIINAIMSDVDV